MNDSVSEQNLARDHKRIQLLLRYIILAIVLSVVVGLIGGYMIYRFMPAGKYPVALFYIPGFLTLVISFVSLFKIKKKWFPTQESMQAASEYKPPNT